MATAPYFDGTQSCKNDPELFFPELPARPKAEDKRYYSIAVATAKAVCNECPFIDACLQYALHNDVMGIWGGTNDSDRNEIRKRKKIPPPKSLSSMVSQWIKDK